MYQKEGDKMTKRTTKPDANNPYYQTKSCGGYSPCLNISDGYVLANCVGYALGRFNEIIGEGWKYFSSMDAKYIYYNCPSDLTKSNEPKPGDLMCFDGGGYGHVCIVEEVKKTDTDIEVITSNSMYGGDEFYLKTRKKSEGYNYEGFQGFIHQPTPAPEPTIKTYTFKRADIERMYISAEKIEITTKV